MSIHRVECPECGAGLKSAAGFKAGQTIACPKCETYFQAPAQKEEEAPSAAKTTPLARTKSLKPDARPTAKTAPLESESKKLSKTTKIVAAAADEDDEEDRPKKKKRKKKRKGDDEEEWSYSKSWVRVAVLGVLLIILGVLGYLLYQKNQREKEADKSSDVRKDDDTPRPRPDAGKTPQPTVGGNTGDLSLTDLRTRLVGTWSADENDNGTNVANKLEYRADGSFTYTRTPEGGEAKTYTGKWSAVRLIPPEELNPKGGKGGRDGAALRLAGIIINRSTTGEGNAREVAAVFRNQSNMNHQLPDPYLKQLVFIKR
jgi:hypothetical protein